MSNRPHMLRPALLKEYTDFLVTIQNNMGLINNPRYFNEYARKRGVTPQQMRRDIDLEIVEYSLAIRILDEGKIVLFDADQAAVLYRSKVTTQDRVEFQLPFEATILQFSRPIEVEHSGIKDELIAILLFQRNFDPDEMRRAKETSKQHNALWGSTWRVIEPTSPDVVINNVVCVFSDHNLRKLTWHSDDVDTLLEVHNDPDISNHWDNLRDLAISCIAYINCENVHLHLESVPEHINRKRERRNKLPLDPYYTCHLRGVQYDAHAQQTGQGTKHSFRYDVRGHRRRLKSGQTIWIPSHQRGLANELYLPKAYHVNERKRKEN